MSALLRPPFQQKRYGRKLRASNVFARHSDSIRLPGTGANPDTRPGRGGLIPDAATPQTFTDPILLRCQWFRRRCRVASRHGRVNRAGLTFHRGEHGALGDKCISDDSNGKYCVLSSIWRPFLGSSNRDICATIAVKRPFPAQTEAIDH